MAEDKYDGWFKLLILLLSSAIVLPLLQTLGGVFWLNGPTLSHISDVFGDIPWTLELARNSFCLALWTVTTCMVPAIPLGFILFRTRVPGRFILIAIMILAAAIPMFVVSAAWTAVIGNDYWFSMQSWYEKVLVGGLVQAIAWLPLATLLSGVAFTANDGVQEEVGLLDTHLAKLFFRISIPSASKGLVAIALLLTLFSLGDITVTDCIRLNTFQQECYTQFQLPEISIVDENFELLKPRRAAAVVLPYVAFIIALGLVLLPKLRRLCYPRSAEGEEKGSRTHTLKGVSLISNSVFAWGLPLAIFGFPLFRLLITLGDWSTIPASFNASAREICVTLISSAVAAVVATLIAFVWTCHAGRTPFLLNVYGALCVLLLALPAPLVGISLIVSLNNDWLGWLYASPAVYVYALVLRFLPFSFLIIYPDVQQLTPELREESHLAGATAWQYMIYVQLPNAWRGLCASFLLVFILGIGEIGASFLVQSPGYTTLSVRFFTMIHSGMDSGVAALCLVVMGTTALPASLFSWVMWKRVGR